MRRLVFLFLFLLSIPALRAANVPEYAALRAARPDGRTSAVTDLVMDRDVYRFTFRSGTFHFLSDIGGSTVAAVFLGDGSYRLNPATRSERRQLELMTRERDLEVLEDDFTEMVLLFTDKTAVEIQKRFPAKSGQPDGRAIAVYEKSLERQKRDLQTNLHLRVVEDLLNRPGRSDGVFLAMVAGKKYAPALLAIDPLGISNLAAKYASFSGEEVAFISLDDQNPGFWYLCTTRANAKDGASTPIRPVADAESYVIDTRIEGEKIRGTTTIVFKPLVDGLRVLPLEILPKLKLAKAEQIAGDTHTELGVVQEDVELGKVARLFKDEVADADAAVVFPEPLRRGEATTIRLEYAGSEVLHAWGELYSVAARESWYPNLGTFTDLATYELRFDFPKRNSLVAIGDLAGEKVEGDRRIAIWKTSKPVRAAGFNYGVFTKISRHDDVSGMTIDVYTQRDWTKKANDVMADAINATRVATAMFGRAPYPRVSVSQQVEWMFGQSWPTLIYFPTMGLTTSAERAEDFGESPDALYGVNEFVKTVGWHEMAHQWWGHRVGWATYRDQWLSEGFAEFTAALVLQFTENMRAYDKYWQQRRETILQKRGSIPNFKAGPISQGYRLYSSQAPGAPQAMIYEKGAYVVHMLRMMMRDASQKNPDEKFAAMMKDFLVTYDGGNPSTADFQKIVEKHMTPAMDATGTRTMDYFFRQWVMGTEIPKFHSAIEVTDAGGGKYRIHGSVSQESVPDDFLTIVPIYLDFGGDNLAKIGMIRLTGGKVAPVDAEIALPKMPKRVVINALHDVLERE